MGCNETAADAIRCEQMQRKWVEWYTADYTYGQGVIYCWTAFIGTCALFYLLSRLIHRKSGLNTRAWQKIMALKRLCGSSDVRIGSWRLMTVTNFLIIGALGIFLAAMSLGPKP
jgi:uncharacterized membrane protein YdjX (TVP38/TMEM64 family)